MSAPRKRARRADSEGPGEPSSALAILPNGDQPGFSSADPIDEGKCRREIGFSPTMRQQPITVFDQNTFGCIARFVVDLIG